MLWSPLSQLHSRQAPDGQPPQQQRTPAGSFPAGSFPAHRSDSLAPSDRLTHGPQASGRQTFCTSLGAPVPILSHNFPITCPCTAFIWRSCAHLHLVRLPQLPHHLPLHCVHMAIMCTPTPGVVRCFLDPYSFSLCMVAGRSRENEFSLLTVPPEQG